MTNQPNCLLRKRLFSALLAVFTFVTAALASGEAVASRVALVIGNSNYDVVPDLNNPVNDAKDVAVALRSIGFEVSEVHDLSQIELLKALQAFQHLSSEADISLVYYAGHGIEVNGSNYLIPIDAKLETDRDISFEAIPLGSAVMATEGAKSLSLIIVDACRNNPFINNMQRTSSSRSIGRGLAKVEPVGNTLVAYAAREGTTAADGDGRNSPYAEALVASLGEPGLEVGLMFRQIRDGVLASTRNAQEPFVYGSLSSEAIFLNVPKVEEIIEPAEEIIVASNDYQQAVMLWDSVKHSTNPLDYEDFLAVYPNSVFALLARQRQKRLSAALAVESQVLETTTIAPVVETQRTTSPAVEVVILDQLLDRSGVREVQERLTILEFAPGPVDGAIGRRTISAIEKFQDERSLTVTGQATESLLAILRDEISDEDYEAFREARRQAALRWQAQQAANAAAAQAAAQAATVVAPPTTTRTNRRDRKSGGSSGSSGGSVGWN